MSWLSHGSWFLVPGSWRSGELVVQWPDAEEFGRVRIHRYFDLSIRRDIECPAVRLVYPGFDILEQPRDHVPLEREEGRRSRRS